MLTVSSVCLCVGVGACGLEPMAATEYEDEPSAYYDILVLGRTGQGKSTTANKLLEIGNREALLVEHREDDREGQPVRAGFVTGEGMDSVTSECKVISNEMSMIRVLDTPGFADTRATREQGVFRSNLRTFRAILQAQDINDLAFCRVLYFLPLRGPLERADGVLQEEIKLMFGFLGEEVFKIMVIIATNRKRKNGKQENFDEDDLKQTQEVFMRALHIITGIKEGERVLERCPPILYLPFLEENVIEKVVGAEVLYEEPLKTPVVVDLSSSVKKTEQLISNAKKKSQGRKLQFRGRCTKCSCKIIYENMQGRRIPVRIVMNESGEKEKTIVHSDSYCHPLLLPKYSKGIKFIGGVAHVATLGIFAVIELLSGKKLWPGFANNEEYCAHCQGPPDADGCLQVGRKFMFETEQGKEEITTHHSTTLDIKLVETTV